MRNGRRRERWSTIIHGKRRPRRGRGDVRGREHRTAEVRDVAVDAETDLVQAVAIDQRFEDELGGDDSTDGIRPAPRWPARSGRAPRRRMPSAIVSNANGIGSNSAAQNTRPGNGKRSAAVMIGRSHCDGVRECHTSIASNGEDQRAEQHRSELERPVRGIHVRIHNPSIAGHFPFSSKSQKTPEVGLLAGDSVDRLSDQVGMAVVPRVLLDHVDEDPAQARASAVGPGPLGQTAPGRRRPAPRRRAARERATASCQSAKSCSGVSSAAECHSQSGSASQSTVSHGGSPVAPVQPAGEPVVLDVGPGA